MKEQGITFDALNTGPLVGSLDADPASMQATIDYEERRAQVGLDAQRAARRRGRIFKYAILVIVLIVGLLLIVLRHGGGNETPTNTSAEQRYPVTSIPLAAISSNSPALTVQNGQTLSINGQLNVNNSLVLAPTSRPDGAVTGQLYYDQASNQLSYYNGSDFVSLLSTGDTVDSLGGAHGSITTGSGLGVSGNTLSNTGVLSLQGISGNVSLVSGTGIAVNGTTLSNSGLLSLGGKTGDILLGTGLSLSGNTLNATVAPTGVQSLTAGTPNVTVTDQGNGTWSIGMASGAGTGTVASSGGTTGKLAVFTGVQDIEDSLVSQSGSTVTVTGSLSVTSSLSLGTALSVANGGTGATSASGARTNLGAAASGVNNDITQLTGLTTALSVAQGGTGVGTLPTNSVLIGNGTSAIGSVTAGSAGLCLVSTAGAPSFQTCPGTGGVVNVNGLTGALTLQGASAGSISSAGSTITINDATSAVKGLASFNATNFTVTGGAVNTQQDINTGATPSFAGLNLGSALSVGNGGTGATTAAGARTNLGAAASGSNSDITALTGLTTAITVSQGGTGLTALTANQLLFASSTSSVSQLSNGTSGQCLISNGAGSAPSFQACTGSGGVTSLNGLTGSITIDNASGSAGHITIANAAADGSTKGIAAFNSTNFSASSGVINTIQGIATTSTPTFGGLTLTTALAVADGGTGATSGPAARTNLGAAASGSNSDITSLSGLTTALSVSQGGTGLSSLTTFGILYASSSSAISQLGLGTSGQCLISNGTGAAPTWQTCSGAGGVSSITGSVGGSTALTGAITINNASTSGSSITISNAAADGSTKGIAAFNSTNFSASSGVVNTVQDIAITSAPTFGQLTLSSSQATADMLTVNNTNASGTGNLLNLELNGTSKLSVAANGNLTTSGTITSGLINGQTISSSANFTGTVSVGSTLSVNTISPTSSLTVGVAGQSFTLQGNTSSTITSTNGTNTTTVSFQSPTANVNYRFAAAAAGNYDICTTAGNCVGAGGGVTTSGGTTGALAVFTGSSTIGDSHISDNGTTVSVSEPLSLTSALTVANGGTGLTALTANQLLYASSTSAIGQLSNGTSGQCLTSNGAGSAPSFQACGGSGGVSSITGSVGGSTALAGAITINNASTASSTITISNAAADGSTKGIAAFNSTNFSASSGIINTIQGIATTSTPTFAGLTLTTSLSLANGGTGGTDATTARSNLGAAASGVNNDITQITGLTTALSVSQGGTGLTSFTANEIFYASSSSTVSQLGYGNNGECLTSNGTGNAPTWQTCPGATGGSVTSVNGLTGAITIDNASASAGHITIANAAADGSTKGIATFNSTNFTASSGVVNTVQDIAVSSAPTFGQLVLSSSQATADMLVVNNTNASASGNLLNLKLNGTSKLSVAANGNLTTNGTITSGLINGQTISSSASFTGSLAVGTTLSVNTITPTSALTVGVGSQAFTLQGNASSAISATSGSFTTTVGFQSPSQNATYNFPGNVAGTYTICTSSGNCAGVGGGVTTSGGTTGALAMFTGGSTIGDSHLSDDGTNLYLTEPLAMTSGGITNTLVFATPTSSNKTITIPDASGTLAVSASGPISLDSAGNLSCPTCLTSGGGGGSAGVSSLNTLTGALTLQGGNTGSITDNGTDTITIADASSTVKGLAKFDGTSLVVTSGSVTTAQDIRVTASPTFAGLTLTTALSVGNGGTGSTTASGARSNLGAAASGANSDITSLSGLTTALSVSQGGTGLSALTANQLLFANTTSSISQLSNGSSGQCLTSNGAGSAPSFQTCAGAGGVSSLNSLTGSITIDNASGSAGHITIANAAADGATKGIAAFNSTDFTATSGVIDTIQGIATTSTPTFGGLTLTTALAVADGGTGATTQSGARTNLAAAASGSNSDITSLSGLTTALSVSQGGTGLSSLTTYGILYASSSSAISQLGLGTSGQCLTSNGSGAAPTWQTCAGAGGVSSITGSVGGSAALTGAVTINNASTASGTITISNAAADGSTKGIAAFNSTNFSASSGVVNTIQDITATSAPTFGQLTLSSSQATADMFTVNNTNASGTGNLLNLKLNGTSKLSVAANGNLTTSGTITSGLINGQTISSTANFTGSVAVGTTLSVNTISPTSSLTVGVAGQSFTLQGNTSSTITSTNGTNTTTVSFQSPTANVNYRFAAAAAGNYDICTTAGNCSGLGGAVTTAGGTTGALAVFTGSNAIGDSHISDNGTTVSVSEPLSLTSALTVANGGTGLAALTANQLLYASSTSAIGQLSNGSSGQCLVSNGAGSAPSFQTCTGAGGVSSITGSVGGSTALTGAVTINNASTSAGAITISNAAADGSTKGIATFNATNFSASSGVINTAQDITTTSAPTFGQLTITSSQATADMLSVNNTNASGTGNLLNLKLNGTSKLSVAANGNLTTNGTITSGLINGQTISSTANFTGSVAVGTTLSVNTISPTSSLTVGVGTQSFTLQGNTSSTLTSTNGTNTTTVSFQSPTANVNYRFAAAAAGNYDICTTAGNCTGLGGAVTTTGGTTGALAMFTGSNAIGDSHISDNGSTVTIGSSVNLSVQGTALFKPSASTTALQVQNASGFNVLTVDTSTPRVVLGNITSTGGAGVAGTLAFADGTSDNFGATLNTTTLTANRTITLPDASGTVCLQNSASCGFATGTSASYIQNQNASQQASSNFWISGTGRADTALQAPLVDTPTAVALNIGTTNATGINLNQSATVAAGKNLVLASGTGTFTQTYTGTSTDAHSITANSLTTGSALKVTSTNNSGANTAWSAINLSVTNAQSTTAVSTGTISGLNLQFVQNPTVAGSTETVANIGVAQNDTATTDSTVSSIVNLANNDTATGNQITVTDGLKINGANVTNGINLSGTFGTNLITSSNFTVTQAGAITGVGVNSGAGLLQGAAGLTITGATASLNASSNFATNINTGTSNGTVTIGGGSAPLVIDSTNFDVSSAGALSGITTIATSSTINGQTISSTANFTGTVAIQGASSLSLGTASSATGSVLFRNGSGSGSITLTPANPSSTAYTITLPAENGTVCTTGSVCTGYAASTGSSNYIQNQNAGQQASSNFWISGTGRADTALQAPLFDTPTATTLAIGTTNATAINLNQSTTIAAGKNLTFASGAGNFDQSGSTGTFATGTGSVSLNGNTTVATNKSFTANGSVLFKDATNSGTAFQIQDTSNASFFTADSVNKIITTLDQNIGSAANLGSGGRLFSDGFESGSFSLWGTGVTTGGSTTVTADTTTVRNGRYAAKFSNNNGAGTVITPVTSSTTIMARAYVYVTSETTNGADLLGVYTAGGSQFILNRNLASGKLSFWNSVTSTGTQGSTVMSTGAWHEIELDLTINASTGTVNVYMDGTNVLSQTSQNTGSNPITKLAIGDDNTNHVAVYSIDDVSADTTRPGDSASLNVNDSLRVAGTASFGNSVLFRGASNSAAALQVQNSSGASLFTVDTANTAITFGSAPGSGLVTNNGATVNSTLALGNFSSGGAIGTAAATVDAYTSISVNQTTASQTLTVPSPTANTTYGRLLYLSNIGSADFTIGSTGTPLRSGATTTLVWANSNGGASWQFAGTDGSSILNQTSTTQTAGFKINGTGTAATFTAGTFSSSSNLVLQAASGNDITISPGAAGGGSGTLNLAVNAATLNIGNNSNNTRAINIGNTGGSQAQTIIIGNNASSTSTTTIQGANGVTINTNSNSAGVLVQSTANSATAFRIQNSTNGNLLVVDTANTAITFGNAAGSGLFTNNGATVNSTLALSNFASGGSIGAASSTVDVYTSISVNQTTGSQTLTVPSPTANTTYGRLLYLSNIGTADFTIGSTGTPLRAGATTTLVWANSNGGASWQFAGTDGSSILNQNSTTQTANFKISGTGSAVTALQAPLFDTVTAGTLSIGTTNATGISLNQSTTIAAGKNLTFASGAGNFDQSGSTGTFASGTGSVSLNGNVTVASNKSFTANGGATFQDATSSSTAFQVQNTAGASLINVDTSAGAITFNQADLRILGIAHPTNVTLTSAGTGGSLAAGTYFYGVTAIAPSGETDIVYSSPLSVTTTGSVSKNTLSWTAVTGATGYKVYRTNDNGTTWYVNSIAVGTTSIVDDGTTYTWSTNAGSIINYQSNSTSVVTLQTGSWFFMDSGAGNGSSGFNYNVRGNYLTMANYNTGGGLVLDGDSLTVHDTTGFHTNLLMTNTGATTFSNRTNSTTAFQIQNAAGSEAFDVDTTATNGNLISNPDFETDASGAAGKGISTVARSTATAQYGTASLLVTNSAFTGQGARISTFTQTVAAGTYTFSFDLRLVSGTWLGTQIQVGYNAGSDTNVCTFTTTAEDALTTGFRRYSCTFTSGANLSSVYIAQTDATARSYYLDGLRLAAGSAAGVYQQANVVTSGSSLTTSGNLFIDSTQTNNCTGVNFNLCGGLKFGYSGTGEGISSNRSVTTASNYNGLDFYTNNTKRFYLTNAGNAVFQNSSNVALFTVDAANDQLVIGPAAGDTTGTILVLGNKTNSGDPTGVTGAMYYNQALGEYRCFDDLDGTAADGSWQACGVNPIDRGFEVNDEFMSGSRAGTSGTTVNATGFGEANWSETAFSSTSDCNSNIQYSPSSGGFTPTSTRPGVMVWTTTSGISSSGQGCSFALGDSKASSNSGNGNGDDGGSMQLAVGDVIKTAIAASSSSGNYVLRIGLHNELNSTSVATTGIWWEANPGFDSHWMYCYYNASTSVCAATTVSITANTFVTLSARINALGTNSSSVTYFINGTKYSISGVTVNTTNSVFPAFITYNTVNNAATSFGIDYYQLQGYAATRR